jgi:hypothetical protein
MKFSFSAAILGAVATLSVVTSVNGFTQPTPILRRSTMNAALSMSTMAESGVPPTSSDATDTEDVEIPTNLPSDCGMDYIPLATMLATGQLAEADQVCIFFSDMYGYIILYMHTYICMYWFPCTRFGQNSSCSDSFCLSLFVSMARTYCSSLVML